MTDTTSPLTKEYPKQDWVRGLSKRDRKENEKVRAADIERDTEGILGVLASIPGFRYSTQNTRQPRRARCVSAASAPRVLRASKWSTVPPRGGAS